MAWVRVGDEFPSDRRWDDVPFEARWYYLCLIADCSRSERYECSIPLTRALRVSDVPHPQGCIDALVAAGWCRIDREVLVVPDGEHNHMPPPAQRDKRRKKGQRERTRSHREGKCQDGEHDEHCPKSCPLRSGNVSGNALPASGDFGVHDADNSDLVPAFDPDTGEVLEGNGPGNALPQDRTGRDRTGSPTGIVSLADQNRSAAADLDPDWVDGMRGRGVHRAV